MYLGAAGVVAQLAAEFLHDGANQPGIVEVTRLPDLLQQMLAGEQDRR